MNNKKGFTLVELLAVIAVLGIILVIAVPKVTNIISENKERLYQSTKKELEKVATQYVTLHPDAVDEPSFTIQLLCDEGLIDCPIVDPRTREEMTGRIYNVNGKYYYGVEEETSLVNNEEVNDIVKLDKITISGKSEQVNKIEGSNLVPPLNLWTLVNGAYFDGDYIVLPNSTSSAYVDVLWNQRASYMYVNFIAYSSIESSGVYLNTRYFDNNYTYLSGNGYANTIIQNKDTSFSTGFAYGGSPYQEDLSRSKYVRISLDRGTTYGKNEYKFKNVYAGITNSAYKEFVPNSPTLKYPSQIESIGTKNLFDYSNIDSKTVFRNYDSIMTLSYLTDINNDKYIHLIGSPSTTNVDTAWNLNFTNSFNVIPLQKYTVSFMIRSNSTHANFLAKVENNLWYTKIRWNTGRDTYLPKNIIYTTDNKWHKLSFTITAPPGVINGQLFIGNDGPNLYNSDYIDIKNIQIEESSYSNNYAPYNVDTVALSDGNNNYYFNTEPLRSLPDGTKDKLIIDNVNKKAYVERNVGSYTFSGNEIWIGPSRDESLKTWSMQSQAINGFNNVDKKVIAISNMLQPLEYYDELSTGLSSVSIHNNGLGSIIFTLSDYDTGLTSSSTDNEINAAFQKILKAKYDAGNPVMVQYKLASTKIEELPYQEVQFNGSNFNLTVGELNSDISIQYIKKG